MIEVKEAKDAYLSEFARLEKTPAGRGHSWLLPIRKAAIARFAEMGFPTTRDEEWRYTNVSAIANTAFAPAARDVKLSPGQLGPYLLGEPQVCRLVFVNGFYAPDLSAPASLPAGVKVGSLAAALTTDAASLEPHLGRYAGFQDNAFVALNTAFMEDGAFINIPRGTVVEGPIHLIFVSTEQSAPAISHPRNLIVAGEASQATIVESYIGLGDGPALTNAVTELVVGESAVVDRYKIEYEEGSSQSRYHVATLQLLQERASNVRSHTLSTGAAIVRNDIKAVLDGEGCECTLNGLYMGTDAQHVDSHLYVDHAKPHCNSWEYYKGVLDGRASGVFSGRIMVREGAQKTDAKQTNMNLLLSEDAQVDTKPQLEIFADDVKCTHGATIGQISDEAIFYLRSRGISEKAARSLLVYAFARESLNEVRVDSLRRKLEQWVFARLPEGQLLEEAI